MRILYIAKLLDLPESNVIRGVAAAGIDVEVLHDPDSRFLEPLKAAGIPTAPLRLKGRVDFPGLRQIRDRVEARRFEVIHTLNNNPLSNALLATRRQPCRIVGYRGVIGGITRFNPGCWLTYYHPRVDRIVCVAEAVRQHLITCGIHPRKLVTIHKGHDPSWYQPADRRVLQEFGIPPEAFVVVCSSNLRRRKGAHILIRSLSLLPAGHPVHLLLMGKVSDPEVEALCRSPEFSARVHRAGFRTDAPALCGACDAAAMPSLRSEGLPKAVIEAMIQGVPVVISRDGGMPELVEDGLSGHIVPPGDTAALAAALRDLYENPARARAMGAQARARIAEHFHVSGTVAKTLSLYRELAEPARQ